MNDNRKFDLSLIDTDKIRKRRRRKLLIYSLLPAVLLLIMSIKFISPAALYAQYSIEYKSGNYKKAVSSQNALTVLNYFEPYKVYYNRGTAYLMDSNYDKAETDLTKALELVPPENECFVRVNLVYALIAKGDELLDSKRYDESIIYYDKSKAIIDARDCGIEKEAHEERKQLKREADEKLKKQRKQAEDNLNRANKARNNDDPDEAVTDGATTEDNKGPSKENIEKIKEQDSQNSINNQKSRNFERGQDSNDNNTNREYAEKPW